MRRRFFASVPASTIEPVRDAAVVVAMSRTVAAPDQVSETAPVSPPAGVSVAWSSFFSEGDPPREDLLYPEQAVDLNALLAVPAGQSSITGVLTAVMSGVAGDDDVAWDLEWVPNPAMGGSTSPSPLVGLSAPALVLAVQAFCAGLLRVTGSRNGSAVGVLEMRLENGW